MKKIPKYTILTLSSLFSAALLASPASTFSGVTNGAPDLAILSVPGGGQGSATKEIMSTTLKVPGEHKSLLIGVSLQSGLLMTTGKKGVTDACAGIDVTVKIDDTIVVDPGTVTFNARCQRQTLTQQGILDLCTDGTDYTQDPPVVGTPDGTIDPATECAFTDDDLDHLLDTTSANHFNFIAPDVGTGTHTISVEATVKAGSSLKGSASAIINVGTLSVEVVRSADDHEDDDHHHGNHHDDLIAE